MPITHNDLKINLTCTAKLIDCFNQCIGLINQIWIIFYKYQIINVFNDSKTRECSTVTQILCLRTIITRFKNTLFSEYDLLFLFNYPTHI